MKWTYDKIKVSVTFIILGVDDDAEEGFNEYEGEELDGDDNSDDSNGDWESEEENDDDDDDDMGAMMGDDEENKNKKTSPFAPAEMYLSDMIGKKREYENDIDDFLIINVSNYLVFSPPSSDPLSATDLQGAVIDLFLLLKNSNDAGMATIF